MLVLVVYERIRLHDYSLIAISVTVYIRHFSVYVYFDEPVR